MSIVQRVLHYHDALTSWYIAKVYRLTSAKDFGRQNHRSFGRHPRP